MGENAFGVGLAFAAENFVAVGGKPVETILFLGRGFLDETRKLGFDRLQFSGVHFEIGMKADEVRESAHARNVCLVAKRVERSGVTTFSDAVIFHFLAALSRRAVAPSQPEALPKVDRSLRGRC
jgi:hypothetical protein